ncbi:MAG: XdhC family protein [Proteobacteria bacterium]|nr:XdhC family protein [Pseudomonadota bacterium]MDA1059484.1 XdhC family protein [Pseudomonadota bacterium]
MKDATLQQVLADQAAKRAVVLATDLASGEEWLIYPFEAGDDRLKKEAEDAARRDKSGVVETIGAKVFLNVYNPPLRLIIVGAVHIAQPLARMAAMTGYDVTVIDPRAAFASEERFPGVTVITEWPDDAMTALSPDARTAIVTLTHDPKIDDPALEVALRSAAFYIGALGSKKTHSARLHRLGEAGFGDNDVARICGPVGLAIGAKSPAEIAVAVLAQITERLRQSPA